MSILKSENSPAFVPANPVPTEVSTDVVKFVNWLRDNYSVNESQGSSRILHYNLWRKDFSDELFTAEELLEEYNKQL